MMILVICEDINFSKHISEDGHSSLSGITRRLSVATNSGDLIECPKNSRVRSLLLFTNESNVLEEAIVNRILTKHRQLKVLVFQDAILLIEYKNLESV